MKLNVACQQIMVLGEGPLWHPIEKCLYWVDIVAASLYRLNNDNSIDKFIMPSEIGSIVWCTQGGLIGALKDRFVTIETVTGRTQNIALPLKGLKNVMFNDGKCDRQGRFWAGTKDNAEQEPIGALYCLDKGNVTEMLNGFTVSNGIAWNLDSSLMYICDSPARQIYQYKFDPIYGRLGKMEIFAQIPKEEGFPDGLTVDSKGYIWSCHWDGWQITRYSPTGQIDSVFPMPVPRPTSCCFGGPDLTTLYVTSASINLTAAQLADAPKSGMVFAIETDIQGLAEPAYLA